MKKITLAVLLLLFAYAWAAPVPNEAEYTITVHVISSHLINQPGMFSGAARIQVLNVLIDGKKYEITAMLTKTGLLAPGDYKARLSLDVHKTPFESSQEYELLFPDKSTRKFYVT